MIYITAFSIINCWWITISVAAEKPLVWDCMKRKNKTACDSKKTVFRYPAIRPEPSHVTIADRISLVGWKYLAELTYLDNPMNEVVDFHNPINCYLSCLKPFTTVWVDNNVVPLFMKNILPSLSVPIILLSGDGDHSTPPDSIISDLMIPETLAQYKKVIAHWYGHNCRPLDSTLEGWITCLPIGLSYINDNIHRRLLHNALNIRHGHYGKLVTNYLVDNNRLDDEIQRAKDQTNSVLVSFKVGRFDRKVAREPVVNFFCSKEDPIPGSEAVSPFRSSLARGGGGGGGGGGGDGKVYCGEFPNSEFHTSLSRFRFVVSPRGYGRDCYRTWETLFMGAYPIVLESHTHSTVYDGLPVLIVSNWTQATPMLLNDTYHRFMAQTWSLDKLYNTYWEREVYSRRLNYLNGTGHRWHYFLL
eukprot:gene33610-43437_t